MPDRRPIIAIPCGGTPKDAERNPRGLRWLGRGASWLREQLDTRVPTNEPRPRIMLHMPAGWNGSAMMGSTTWLAAEFQTVLDWWLTQRPGATLGVYLSGDVRPEGASEPQPGQPPVWEHFNAITPENWRFVRGQVKQLIDTGVVDEIILDRGQHPGNRPGTLRLQTWMNRHHPRIRLLAEALAREPGGLPDWSFVRRVPSVCLHQFLRPRLDRFGEERFRVPDGVECHVLLRRDREGPDPTAEDAARYRALGYIVGSMDQEFDELARAMSGVAVSGGVGAMGGVT